MQHLTPWVIMVAALATGLTARSVATTPMAAPTAEDGLAVVAKP